VEVQFKADPYILKKTDNIRKNCTELHNLRVYFNCILCYNTHNKRVKKNICAFIGAVHNFITIMRDNNQYISNARRKEVFP